jgi:hypothetical protein
MWGPAPPLFLPPPGSRRYGQTGSGKTYTMGTAAGARELAAAARCGAGAAAAGVVPRAVQRVFEYVKQAEAVYDTHLKVGMQGGTAASHTKSAGGLFRPAPLAAESGGDGGTRHLLRSSVSAAAPARVPPLARLTCPRAAPSGDVC